MYRTFFVFLKCTVQGGPKVDVLLIAFLYLWLKFWEVIDKYWIVPVRKLFYFHHWLNHQLLLVDVATLATLHCFVILRQIGNIAFRFMFHCLNLVHFISGSEF